jgi:hypothetical protein
MMRSSLVVVAVVVGCARPPSAMYVTSHYDEARYAVGPAIAREVVIQVFRDRVGDVIASDHNNLETTGECRTVVGDWCTMKLVRGTGSLQGPRPGPHLQESPYHFRLGARFIDDDTGVTIRLGAQVIGRHGDAHEVGRTTVPLWVQREVDTAYAAIDARLAPARMARR